MQEVAVLHRFRTETNRRTELYDLLGERFSAYQFEVANDNERPYVMDFGCTASAELAVIGVGNSHTHRSIVRESAPAQVVALVERGSGRMGSGRRPPALVGANDVAMFRLDRGDWTDFAADGRRTLVEVSDSSIDDVVRRHFHLSPGSPCHFRHPVHSDAGAFRSILHAVEAFADESGAGEHGALGAALRRQHADLVVLTVLTRLPNSLSEILDSASSPATTGHLRRALEHMRACLDEPVQLEDIARAAGCSPRRLQRAFHDQLGMSPLARLRQLRLEAAEARLRSGAYSSVTDVAQSLCYYNPGRFSGEFRKNFGIAPAALLQASRRTG